MIIGVDYSLFIGIDLVSLFSNSPLYISLHDPIVKYKLIILCYSTSVHFKVYWFSILFYFSLQIALNKHWFSILDPKTLFYIYHLLFMILLVKLSLPHDRLWITMIFFSKKNWRDTPKKIIVKEFSKKPNERFVN